MKEIDQDLDEKVPSLSKLQNLEKKSILPFSPLSSINSNSKYFTFPVSSGPGEVFNPYIGTAKVVTNLSEDKIDHIQIFSEPEFPLRKNRTKNSI